MYLLLERWQETYGSLDYLIFEVNDYARWFLQNREVQEWQKRFSVRVIPHTTSRNKADQDLGFSSLASDIEFGRVRLPYGNGPARIMTSRFVDEATNWTSPRDTDDQLLALWFIKNNYQALRPPHVVHGIAVDRPRFQVPPRLRGRTWTGSRTGRTL